MNDLRDFLACHCWACRPQSSLPKWLALGVMFNLAALAYALVTR